MINIELTNEEAELFKKFREYQDYWDLVFKIKNGSAELHFVDGKIKAVKCNNVYRSQKLSTTP